MTYPDLFARYRPLQGRDWLARLPADERRAFSGIGLMHNRGLHRRGGQARAQTAQRDERGRFIRKGIRKLQP